MTTMLDATRREFLADILVHPDEDYYRLVFADWLEEHGGEPERGEFIRVQCRIAEIGHILLSDADCGCDLCVKRRTLWARERELLTAQNFWQWFQVPGWPGTPAAHVNEGREVFVTYAQPSDGRGWYLSLRRGFIAEIALPCADFMDYAPSLFATAPVEVVRLVDKQTRETSAFCWFANKNHNNVPNPADSNWLPWRIAEHLGGSSFQRKYPRFERHEWVHDTEQAALDALSAACVKYGRKLAGLPLTIGPTAKVASRK